MPKLPIKKPGALPVVTEKVTEGVLDNLPDKNILELISRGALKDIPKQDPNKPMTSVPQRDVLKKSSDTSTANLAKKTGDPDADAFFSFFNKMEMGADELKFIMEDFNSFIDNVYDDVYKGEGIFLDDAERLANNPNLIEGEDFLRYGIPDEGKLQQFIYDETQRYLEKFPEEMYVFRQGEINNPDSLFSFSVDPAPKELIRHMNRGAPVDIYKVKKTDIEAAPNAILEPNYGIPDEEEILIRAKDVTKVGENSIQNLFGENIVLPKK
tara:strand:+ start:2966 stop:3769 length:804 start_codon:yes stop_codon:yes gene_type:complete